MYVTEAESYRKKSFDNCPMGQMRRLAVTSDKKSVFEELPSDKIFGFRSLKKSLTDLVDSTDLPTFIKISRLEEKINLDINYVLLVVTSS